VGVGAAVAVAAAVRSSGNSNDEQAGTQVEGTGRAGQGRQGG
jgi:hypothetical protein